jgi:hypothetical protein
MFSPIFIIYCLAPSAFILIIPIIFFINRYRASKQFILKWQRFLLILIFNSSAVYMLAIFSDNFIKSSMTLSEVYFLNFIIIFLIIIFIKTVIENIKMYILEQNSILRK